MQTMPSRKDIFEAMLRNVRNTPQSPLQKVFYSAQVLDLANAAMEEAFACFERKMDLVDSDKEKAAVLAYCMCHFPAAAQAYMICRTATAAPTNELALKVPEMILNSTNDATLELASKWLKEQEAKRQEQKKGS